MCTKIIVSVTLVLCLFINGCANYEIRNQSPKLTWVDSSIVINAPIDSVWKIIAVDFSENHKHMLGVENSYYLKQTDDMINSIRRSEHGGDEYIDVKITHWAPSEKFIQWQIIEETVPLLSDGVGSYQLEKIEENKTRLIQSGGYRMRPKVLDGFAKGKIKSMFKDILLGIRFQVETGKPFSQKDKKDALNTYGKDIEFL